MFDLVILRFLVLWKVSVSSRMSGLRLVINCRKSESTINSALLMATKTKLFDPISGWDLLIS